MVWLDLGLNPGLPDHWRILYSLCLMAPNDFFIFIVIFTTFRSIYHLAFYVLEKMHKINKANTYLKEYKLYITEFKWYNGALQLTSREDCSHIFYLHWKSQLCIQNMDDTRTRCFLSNSGAYKELRTKHFI